MKKFIIFVFLCGSTLMAEKKFLVNVPVTSLWTQVPDQEEAKGPYKYPLFGTSPERRIPHHDTQLLLGECVELLDVSEESENKEYVKVRALEQAIYDKKEKKWDVCCGWVKAADLIQVDKFPRYNAVITTQVAHVYAEPGIDSSPVLKLSIGTLIRESGLDYSPWRSIKLPSGKRAFIQTKNFFSLPPKGEKKEETDEIWILRKRLVFAAKSFLGSPYCWGGCSAYQKDVKDFITSVDCSGLIYLVLRACGLSGARNAFDQYKLAVPVEPKDLLPGDIVFIKKINEERVPHVLMYVGDNNLLDAPGLFDRDKKYDTRIISVKEAFGKELKEMHNGYVFEFDKDNSFEIHGGSFLSDQDLLKKLQDRLLNV